MFLRPISSYSAVILWLHCLHTLWKTGCYVNTQKGINQLHVPTFHHKIHNKIHTLWKTGCYVNTHAKGGSINLPTFHHKIHTLWKTGCHVNTQKGDRAWYISPRTHAASVGSTDIAMLSNIPWFRYIPYSGQFSWGKIFVVEHWTTIIYPRMKRPCLPLPGSASMQLPRIYKPRTD